MGREGFSGEGGRILWSMVGGPFCGKCSGSRRGIRWRVGRGLCADSFSGESSLAILLGLDGDSWVVFFRAALLFFSAPLGCSPLRSLSQSPRPPEGGPATRGAGAEAVALLLVRLGGMYEMLRRAEIKASSTGGNVIKLSRNTSNLKASLSEGGARRAEGVSQARHMECMIVAYAGFADSSMPA